MKFREIQNKKSDNFKWKYKIKYKIKLFHLRFCFWNKSFENWFKYKWN